MKNQQILKSQEDASVNFVIPRDQGFFEARYVRRIPEYFIAYLSSHSGCNKGCQFCHLTATRQTSMEHASFEDYMKQARKVLNYASKQEKARAVNYNWMSRGEPLANKNLLKNSQEILTGLTSLSIENDLIPKFNISTIIPNEMKDLALSEVFKGITPTIYYSLYSLDKSFRKKWMPAAIDPLLALDNLKDYQRQTSKIIKLHWAFIENVNDSLESLDKIINEIDKRSLNIDFNLVRYNPYSTNYGSESSEDVIKRNANFIQERIKGKVKIISRVGFDVKASCGMFVK